MAVPEPRALAWNDDGELDAQDRFDLLQNLMLTENDCVQMELIAAIERLTLEQVSLTGAVTQILSG
ncbi:hypothetical protein EVJ50_01715 [Synechococcus sp. RSCCF101]|uniref:hypothetical protein n=1 Tax=Synechococcus sp. RSCCF101 TaxID=2511069 RepID=UPI001243CC16|nr:hypothetical protein [Synechococcus sp. RSCCF101]QEY31156.1 hypothetical protein EVJ50_01715 [Synechococcus sp. RSCCF101]